MPLLHITPQMRVEAILDMYPATAKVFVKKKLSCVGCPIGHHHTLEDVVAENRLDMAAFLDELVQAAQSQG